MRIAEGTLLSVDKHFEQLDIKFGDECHHLRVGPTYAKMAEVRTSSIG